MLPAQPSSDSRIASPVILGAGLTGLAISRALSSAGIRHALVGERPPARPRLGESLNAEGSLEITRQFPDLARFFFHKQRQALFFGGHAVSIDSIRYDAGPAYYPLAGYPSTVQLLHVDRVGFDGALYESAIADPHCVPIADRAASLDYDPGSGRILRILLASGRALAPTYVFDATNHTRFVARKLGVRFSRVGEPLRVVFAHYRPANAVPDPAPRWMNATSLLRLDSRTDPVEGLAWCIPIGDYVSVGISVDPAKTVAAAALLLDQVEDAWSARGIDIRSAFPRRGDPVDLAFEHYNHETCNGRNWLLAGPSCCQFWFPSAAGVATGLMAARLAPAVLQEPEQAAQWYQAYINKVTASHSGLDWLFHDDPWSVTAEELQRRAQAMIGGNVRRLGNYLSLGGTPAELAFGDALPRAFASDRLLANPLRVETAPPEAQATRLFATNGAPNPWMDEPVDVPVLTRPDTLEGPLAIFGLVEILSGRQDVETSAALVTADLTVRIDQFRLVGVAQWNAWVTALRGGRRVTQLELVPGSLAASGTEWVLTCQWRGVLGTRPSVSPPFSITFRMANERVAEIATHRADYTFVTGDSILPPAAFAVAMGQILANARA